VAPLEEREAALVGQGGEFLSEEALLDQLFEQLQDPQEEEDAAAQGAEATAEADAAALAEEEEFTIPDEGLLVLIQGTVKAPFRDPIIEEDLFGVQTLLPVIEWERIQVFFANDTWDKVLSDAQELFTFLDRLLLLQVRVEAEGTSLEADGTGLRGTQGLVAEARADEKVQREESTTQLESESYPFLFRIGTIPLR
jgi:hypothetical protein